MAESVDCLLRLQVVNVYLFHELPAEAQKAAAKEMARVCKPGGMVIVTDSTQLGDRKEWDATLGGFGDFNEPYYRNYITTDLGTFFPPFTLPLSGALSLSLSPLLTVIDNGYS